jgi:hypothetical protein
MKRARAPALACLALLAALPATSRAACALANLAPFTAHYEVSVLGGLATVGEYRVSLVRTGPDTFRYETLSRPVGIFAWFKREKLIERSDWTLDGQVIRPLDTLYRKRRGDRQRIIRTRFDWSAMRAVQDDDGHTTILKIHNGVLDRILFQVAMMRDMLRDRRPLDYRFVDKGRLKTFRFKIEDTEKVDTPLGTFEAVKLERVPLPGEKPDYVWAAPRLCYLPVRIAYQRSDGPAFNMILDALQGNITTAGQVQAQTHTENTAATP